MKYFLLIGHSSNGDGHQGRDKDRVFMTKRRQEPWAVRLWRTGWVRTEPKAGNRRKGAAPGRCRGQAGCGSEGLKTTGALSTCKCERRTLCLPHCFRKADSAQQPA